MADIGIFSAQVRLLNLDEEIAHAEEQLSKLDVSFQEVVHPVLSEEAEVVEALANPRRTE
jgi:hypothetical protein